MNIGDIAEELRRLLSEHQRQFRLDPATADRSLLEDGRRLLQAHLREPTLDPEIVYLGYCVLFHLDDRPGIVDLMTQYLRQPMPAEKEAWARWTLIDYTAALSYPVGPEPCQRVVEMHKEFLAWARTHLPKDRLLWVMYDGTQAVCWRLAGHGEEWLDIFQEVIAAASPTAENRWDRFVYLRTASTAQRVLGHQEEALATSRWLRDLCAEDPDWDKVVEVRLSADCLDICVHDDRGDAEGVRRLGAEAAAFLRDRESAAGATEGEARIRLAEHYGGLGAALYFARQYDLAIPLMEHGHQFGADWSGAGASEWDCLRLAGATWATTQDREQTLAWLRRGAALSGSGRVRLDACPELTAMADDPEFQVAAAGEDWPTSAARPTHL